MRSSCRFPSFGICLAFRRLKDEPVIEPHVRTNERDPKKAVRVRALEEEALKGASGG